MMTIAGTLGQAFVIAIVAGVAAIPAFRLGRRRAHVPERIQTREEKEQVVEAQEKALLEGWLDEIDEGCDVIISESKGPRILTVTIKRNFDGKTRDDIQAVGPEIENSTLVYMWAAGNSSCDCNRHIYFERAGGNEPDVDRPRACGSDQYSITRFHIRGAT